jgi:hypothetical protein
MGVERYYFLVKKRGKLTAGIVDGFFFVDTSS